MFSFLFVVLFINGVVATDIRLNDNQIQYINTTLMHGYTHQHVAHSMVRGRVWDNTNKISTQHHVHHDPTPTPTIPVTTNPPTITTTQPPTTPVPITTQPPQATLAPPSSGISPPVTYHNNILVKSIPTLYLIYYGDWALHDPLSIPLITEYLTHLSGSTVMNIATTYYDNTPPGTGTRYLTNLFNYGGHILNTTYPYGTTLSDSNLYYLISDAITKTHTLPPVNSSNIYFVITSPDVNVVSGPNDGFCVTYCGYHTANIFNMPNTGYWGFIGSSVRCNGCSAPGSLGSPNNAPNADSMISIIHHELFEVFTDPLVYGGWYDSNNEEIGDRCQWNYQLVYHTTLNNANGAYANVRIGARDYLIQSMLVNQHGGYCANILY